jgi:hypothetical protein
MIMDLFHSLAGVELREEQLGSHSIGLKSSRSTLNLDLV